MGRVGYLHISAATLTFGMSTPGGTCGPVRYFDARLTLVLNGKRRLFRTYYRWY